MISCTDVVWRRQIVEFKEICDFVKLKKGNGVKGPCKGLIMLKQHEILAKG